MEARIIVTYSIPALRAVIGKARRYTRVRRFALSALRWCRSLFR